MSDDGKKKQTAMAVVAVVLIALAGVLVMWNYEMGPFKKTIVPEPEYTSTLTDEEKAAYEKARARDAVLQKATTPSGS